MTPAGEDVRRGVYQAIALLAARAARRPPEPPPDQGWHQSRLLDSFALEERDTLSFDEKIARETGFASLDAMCLAGIQANVKLLEYLELSDPPPTIATEPKEG